MKELLSFINTIQGLDIETEDGIKRYFVEKVFKKNELILEESKICNEIFFIRSGLVQRFYLKDGNEITKWIYHDNHWVTSISSFFNTKPSFDYLQVCEDTTVYSLSAVNEQKLLEYPLFLKFHVQFLRSSFAAFDEFHFVFDTMSAQEKYHYLLDHFPLMIQKSKQKHIASLLNVSQERLSRIRASIS